MSVSKQSSRMDPVAPHAEILVGDALKALRRMGTETVQCAVTSPPYFGLRDYKIDGQIGLESTPEEHIEKLVLIFREVRRVLRRDGVLWVNYGDAFTKVPGRGRKVKDLVGLPWMLAFALRDDGWWLRSDVIWRKPNPMVEGTFARPVRSHEHIFLLSKEAEYFYDLYAVRNPGTEKNPHGSNLRDVWDISIYQFRGAHFATFPPELASICIKLGTSEKGCCPECGLPWKRIVEKEFIQRGAMAVRKVMDASSRWEGVPRGANKILTIGWKPSCSHALPPVPCIILDPFGGTGTTSLVALSLGRSSVLVELNPEYVRLARKRILEASKVK
jgi:DNA modification methylase